MTTPRKLLAWAACSAVSVLATACSSGRQNSSDTIFRTSTTAVVTTTPAATTTTVVPTTTAPVTTTTTSTTTSTTTTTSSTMSTTSTTEAPTTTTEPPGASVPLRFDGLGDVRFGVAPDDVISYLNGILGNPTADSNWVSAAAIGCEGTEARTVFWDDLKVTFGDESDVSTGRRHFFTWSFGGPAGPVPKPAGMATLLGVTIGTTVADIMKAYPAATLNVGDANTDASAELTDGLLVYLTDTTKTGEVTKLVGGTPCTK